MNNMVSPESAARDTGNRAVGNEPQGFAHGLEEGLIAAVRQIQPLLRRNAPIGEAQRSMTDEVLHTLERLGLWSLLLPPRWGGKGLSSTSFSRINREVAKGDPAVAWVVQIINGCTWIASLTSDRLQEELFAQGIPRFCSSFAVAGTAKPVSGGFLVEGTWPYNSGCRQSSWGQYLVNLQRDDGTVGPGNFVYIPMTDLTILDTWYTVGMQGTSSDSVTGKNVFVPEHRFVAAEKSFGYREPGKRHVGAPSDNWQVFPLIRAAGLGQLVGAVEAALELALEGAQRKPVPNTTYTKQMNSPVIQRNLGEAAAKIDTAALLVDSLCGVQDQAALAARQFTPLERARQKAGCALAIDLLSTALEKIMFVAGSSAFAQASELQRFWRDFNMAARHAIYLPDFGYEVYGAMRLGVNQTAVPPNLV
jgi:3-hydroxy-9,10-secoandrosta-1,3,5(10)-triene-9,17-dione monooxygenase